MASALAAGRPRQYHHGGPNWPHLCLL